MSNTWSKINIVAVDADTGNDKMNRDAPVGAMHIHFDRSALPVSLDSNSGIIFILLQCCCLYLMLDKMNKDAIVGAMQILAMPQEQNEYEYHR